MKDCLSLLGWQLNGYPMPTPDGAVEFQLFDRECALTLHPNMNVQILGNGVERVRGNSDYCIFVPLNEHYVVTNLQGILLPLTTS